MLSTDEWIKKTHTQGNIDGLLKKKKKSEIMPFAATWMDLGMIISSKKDKYITYMWTLKK